MTFLSLRSVHKSYDGNPALSDIDLDVPVGSRTVIVGPSASGKTTLLRIISGFDTPDHGTVTLGGRELANGDKAVPAYLRGIGYVAQDGALFPHLTVDENIGFGLALTGTARHERVLQLLDMVELPSAILARRPDQLSGGQQQRVAIARALAQQPRLMLLDEPFSALDTGLREATRKSVGKILSAAGITTILVTHDQTEALTFADQVAVLHNGQLAQAGSPHELYLRPKTIAVATYLGEAIVLPAALRDGFANCALGRIQADSGDRSGTAKLLLRPEQVRLTEVSSAVSAGTNACYGEIIDIDYAGSYNSVTVQLRKVNGGGVCRGDGPSLQPSIVVRTTSLSSLSVGAAVRVEVDGAAHIFPRDAEAAGAGC